MRKGNQRNHFRWLRTEKGFIFATKTFDLLIENMKAGYGALATIIKSAEQVEK